jgi:cbb3-type cytochrome oxidase maturation protein
VNVIFILIAVSLLVAIGFLVSFIWSIRSGQYEDEYTPSVRILFDDEVNVVEEKTACPVQSEGKILRLLRRLRMTSSSRAKRGNRHPERSEGKFEKE